MNTDTKQTREEKLEQIKLQLITDRMLSLIKSTVDINKVVAKPGPKWAYNTKPNNEGEHILTYPIHGDWGIKTISEAEAIGCLLHEVAHGRYSEQVDLNKIYVEPEDIELYSLVLNTLEDVRIERAMTRRFIGTYDNFQESRNMALRGCSEEELMQMPPHVNLLTNIYLKEWGKEQHFLNDKVRSSFDKTVDTVEEIVTSNSSQELNDRIFQGFWAVIKDLMEEDPSDDQDQNDNSDDQDDNDQQDNNSSNTGQPNNNSDNDDDNSQDDKTDQNNSNQTPPKKDYSNKTSFDDILKEVNKNHSPDRDDAFFDKVNNKAEEELDDSQILAMPNMDLDNVRDYTPMTYEEMYDEIKGYIPYFYKKMNSILADNNLQRYGGAYKSGKLNNKTLYKVKCHNQRIFSKKILRQHKKYSVSLVIDESSSMQHNNRLKQAALSAVLLSEVLNKLSIPFEVIGFNDDVRVYKKFHQKFNWAVKRNFEFIQGQSGITSDAFALNKASRSINKQDSENIIFMLCDGDPFPSYEHIPKEDKRELPNNFQRYSDFDLEEEVIKASKRSEVIGVGIDTNSMRKYYKEFIGITNVSQLPKNLLSILKKHIKRG